MNEEQLSQPGGDLRLVAVYAAPDALQAQIVRGVLEAEGIPAFIGEQVTDAYAAPLSVAEGFWGEVCVRDADAEMARAVLDAYESGRGSAFDEELAAQAAQSSDPNV